MRLYQKAAVCLLAAAMAVSMMTACGGAASGDDNGEKPSSSASGDEKPGDDKGDNKDDGGKKDDTDDKGDQKDDTGKDDLSTLPDLSTESGNPIAWENSYSMQAMKKLSGNSYTMNVEVTDLRTGTVALEKIAVSNGNDYLKVTNGDKSTILIHIDGVQYQLMPEKKLALKYIGKVTSNNDSSGQLVGVTKAGSGKFTVDGTDYFAEKVQAVYKDEKGTYTQTAIYCFDEQKQLAYSFIETKDNSIKTKYIGQILTTADPALFKIPSGYKVYSFDDNGMCYDENGNVIDAKTFAEIFG